MLTVLRLQGCRIIINARDHHPPHVHVRMSDGREALVVIASGEVLTHSVRLAEMAEALDWIDRHARVLTERFLELQR